jgi:hypothetical protein
MSNLIKAAHAAGKQVLVTGCVPQGDKKATDLQDVSLLGEQSGKEGTPTSRIHAHVGCWG